MTANVQYAVTNDIASGAGQLFQSKVWALSGQVTSHLLLTRHGGWRQSWSIIAPFDCEPRGGGGF